MREPEGVALDDGWVKGKGLETAIALKAMQMGDRVLCLTSDRSTYYYGVIGYGGQAYWEQPGYAAGVNVTTTSHAGAIKFKQVIAWKPCRRSTSS